MVLQRLNLAIDDRLKNANRFNALHRIRIVLLLIRLTQTSADLLLSSAVLTLIPVIQKSVRPE